MLSYYQQRSGMPKFCKYTFRSCGLVRKSRFHRKSNNLCARSKQSRYRLKQMWKKSVKLTLVSKTYKHIGLPLILHPIISKKSCTDFKSQLCYCEHASTSSLRSLVNLCVLKTMAARIGFPYC